MDVLLTSSPSACVVRRWHEISSSPTQRPTAKRAVGAHRVAGASEDDSDPLKRRHPHLPSRGGGLQAPVVVELKAHSQARCERCNTSAPNASADYPGDDRRS